MRKRRLAVFPVNNGRDRKNQKEICCRTASGMGREGGRKRVILAPCSGAGGVQRDLRSGLGYSSKEGGEERFPKALAQLDYRGSRKRKR